MLSAAVITISDKGYRGEREDLSGPLLVKMLKENNFDVTTTSIIPDEKEMIESTLIDLSNKNIALILTTGGTGFAPRDITPEATKAVIERETPGLSEIMRAESMKITPFGCLSRGVSGIRGNSLIINLPGSPKAANENLMSIIKSLPHAFKMFLGDSSHE